MEVQWLRLCVSTAGDMGSMPGWANEDPEMSCSVAKKNRETNSHTRYTEGKRK